MTFVVRSVQLEALLLELFFLPYKPILTAQAFWLLVVVGHHPLSFLRTRSDYIVPVPKQP